MHLAIARRIGPDGLARIAVVTAQLLALAALALGLLFVVNTTGGTLFLFSSAAPALVGVSVALMLAVGIVQLRRRHSLFAPAMFSPGEIVFRQGTPGDCAYFIQTGEVEIVREDGGAETVLARLGPGQYFGEMALLTDQPRNATVRAVAPTRAAALGKANFLRLLRLLPSTREDILKTVQERAMRA